MNLLNDASDPKFLTTSWNIANAQSNANYSVGKEIMYNTEVLKPNLFDYNDTNILVRCVITIIGRNLATEVAF